MNYGNGPNTFRSSSNFTRTINCRYTNAINGVYPNLTVNSGQTAFKYWESFVVYNYTYDNGPCELFNLVDIQTISGVYKSYYFYTAGLYVTLTEESDGSISWHAYTIIDEDGHMLNNLYEYTLIASGTVIIP